MKDKKCLTHWGRACEDRSSGETVDQLGMSWGCWMQGWASGTSDGVPRTHRCRRQWDGCVTRQDWTVAPVHSCVSSSACWMICPVLKILRLDEERKGQAPLSRCDSSSPSKHSTHGQTGMVDFGSSRWFCRHFWTVLIGCVPSWDINAFSAQDARSSKLGNATLMFSVLLSSCPCLSFCLSVTLRSPRLSYFQSNYTDNYSLKHSPYTEPKIDNLVLGKHTQIL